MEERLFVLHNLFLLLFSTEESREGKKERREKSGEGKKERRGDQIKE